MKFGGTSVADAEAMNRVIGIVRRQAASGSTPPVVVVSAMSKVTDRLVETGRLAGLGEGDSAAQLVADLLTRHLEVASTLVPGSALGALTAALKADFDQLTTLVREWAAA